VEDGSTLENVSGYNGGITVTFILEVWFDDEDIGVDEGVGLIVSSGRMLGKDAGEVALTVVADSADVTFATDNVDEDGNIVWFNDEVVGLVDGVESLESLEMMKGKPDTVALTALIVSECVTVATENVGEEGSVV